MVSTTVMAFALGMSLGVKACAGPNIYQAAINLIKDFEGFVPNLYNDQMGHATVGYGHACIQPSCAEVPYPIPLSEANGEALLHDDIKHARQCITRDCSKVTLNVNQYGALVSWAFNVGCGNSGSSNLIRRLNNGEDPNTVAREELPQWHKGGLPDLIERRAAELELFLTSTSDEALPGGC